MDIAVVILLVAIVVMVAIVLAALTLGRITSDPASVPATSKLPGVVSLVPDARADPQVDVVRSPDGGFQVLEGISG